MANIEEAYDGLVGMTFVTALGAVEEHEIKIGETWHNAARALAESVREEMIEIVKPLIHIAAEVDMAAVYKANDLGADLRAKIAKLGKERPHGSPSL